MKIHGIITQWFVFLRVDLLSSSVRIRQTIRFDKIKKKVLANGQDTVEMIILENKMEVEKLTNNRIGSSFNSDFFGVLKHSMKNNFSFDEKIDEIMIVLKRWNRVKLLVWNSLGKFLVFKRQKKGSANGR